MLLKTDFKFSFKDKNGKYDFLIMHGENLELAEELKQHIAEITGSVDSAILQKDFDIPGRTKLSLERYLEQCRFILMIVQDTEGVESYKQQLTFLKSLDKPEYLGRVIPAFHGNPCSNHDVYSGVNPLDLDGMNHCINQIKILLQN